MTTCLEARFPRLIGQRPWAGWSLGLFQPITLDYRDGMVKFVHKAA